MYLWYSSTQIQHPLLTPEPGVQMSQPSLRRPLAHLAIATLVCLGTVMLFGACTSIRNASERETIVEKQVRIAVISSVRNTGQLCIGGDDFCVDVTPLMSDQFYARVRLAETSYGGISGPSTYSATLPVSVLDYKTSRRTPLVSCYFEQGRLTTIEYYQWQDGSTYINCR